MSDPEKLSLGESLSSLFTQWIEVEKEYSVCLSRLREERNLVKEHFDHWDAYFKDSKWDKAIEEYKKVLGVDKNIYQANYNIGSAYLNQHKYKEALVYYVNAKDSAESDSQIFESQKAIDDARSKLQEEKNNNGIISNDAFSRLQYYLRALHIPEAWEKVNSSHEVIVAVIDDGVNINHPDLTDHIWIEPGASYGSSKIKDFVGDKLPDNFPTWEHGTMVAGIIGASTNNEKGIAGIWKNVKIMPLRVSDFEWKAREENVINAIYYAIRNNANIINLSLGQSQFAYSKKYDEVLRLAYERGIIVVIAAGNGDVLSYKANGVNTTVNPLSPVCNNTGDKLYSIGIGALNQQWIMARWTNYGHCVNFYVPGENIFSTSVSIFNEQYGVDYNTDSGTSFSAPMVSGIIALGYNQFGYVNPDVVYQSLMESLQANAAGNVVINAGKYIDILTAKRKIIQQEQARVRERKYSFAIQDSSYLDSLWDAEYLAALGYIDKKDPNGYALSDQMLRQEAVALAMNILGAYVPSDYVCRGIFQDVTSKKPNSWACRVIENASLLWILPEKPYNFRPEEPILLARAIYILLRAGWIPVADFQGWNGDAWRIDAIGSAFKYWLVAKDFDFTSDRMATRGEVFHIAREILNIDKK